MRLIDIAGNTLVYIMGAGGVAGTTVYVRGRTNRSTHSKQQAADVQEIKVALVGAKPTDVNPNPPPGIIQRLDDYQDAMRKRTDMGDTLITAFAKQESVVGEIKRTLSDVTTATLENGKEIKELREQMTHAVTRAEAASIAAAIAAEAAAKAAATTVAATKKNGGDSPSVGDTAGRTEDIVKDLTARLEVAGVISAKGEAA